MLIEDIQALVVDSDDDYRNSLCDSLVEIGFKLENLICATTTAEAKEILDIFEDRDAGIGLIFIEARLESVEGYSVCTIVQECNKMSIPVYLTAFVNEFGPIRAMSVRMQGFLKKPFNKINIRTHIERWLKILELEHSILTKFDIGCDCNANLRTT